jgi:hypothetical protein
MYKKIFVIVLIQTFMFTQFAIGQSVEEIISKHVDAMGGREKIMTLKTALCTGTFTTPGAAPINIVATKKHMVGSRIDITIEGTNNYRIITQKNGWIFTPVQGDKEPRPLVDDQFKEGQTQLDLHGPFVNYREKGIKISVLGKDTVNGFVCYKLRAVYPNANVTDFSIDIKTNFIVKTSTKMFQFGALEDVATTYSDYRQNADGYWFAYDITNPRGETKYERIETNMPIAEKVFQVK